MKFEGYHFAPEVFKGIKELGFRRPTDIQYKCIPHILKGEDLLAVAQTGTGKTAAFAIPILHLLHMRKKNQFRPDGIKCIVMVPTHELAMQITGVFQEIGRFSRVNIIGIYGGVEQEPQIEALHGDVDVLVATPGRMFDLISQKHLRINRVEVLIVDEADHMLDLGFIKDIEELSGRLPRKRQTLFFSATIGAQIKKLAYSLIRKNAIRIQISPKDPVSKNVDHRVGFVEMDDKRFFLERLINEYPERKMLIFVRTKVRAERVAKAMARVEISTLTIHSDKDQHSRTEIIEKFRAGEVRHLIATDVAARGIDIPDVDYVINYDLPEQPENYVHRVGRTGRGKRRGKAMSFCSENEKPLLAAIEKYTGNKIPEVEISEVDHSDTLLFSRQEGYNFKDMLREIEELEERQRKKKKQKKSR